MVNTNPLDAEYWSRSAASSAANPGTWLMSAGQLRRSADVLRAQWQSDMNDLLKNSALRLGLVQPPTAPLPSVAPAMLMLLALALENLAKGLFVARNPDHPPFGNGPDTKLALVLKGHLSVNLLARSPGPGKDAGAGVTLSAIEREQVERLQRFLLWGGRYPVPTDSMAMHYTNLRRPPASFSSDDLVVIDQLLDRVHVELEQELRKWADTQRALTADQQPQKWSEALVLLAPLERVEQDGLTVYVDSAAADEPNNAVSCGGCWNSFEVRPCQPGVICACGHLHYLEMLWDPPLADYRPNVLYLPAAARPAEPTGDEISKG